MSRNPDSRSVIQDPNNSAQHSRTWQGNGLSSPALVDVEPQRRGKSIISDPISSSVDVGCIFYTPLIDRSLSPSFSGDYGRVEAIIALGVARRRKAHYGAVSQDATSSIYIGIPKQLGGWACNLEARGSMPALTASWTCSRQSRVQLLGHACKWPTGFPSATIMKATGLPVIAFPL